MADNYSNRGKKWLADDDVKLIQLCKTKNTKELADMFKRTERGITMRIETLAKRDRESGKDDTHILNTYGFTKQQLDDVIQRLNKENDDRKTKRDQIIKNLTMNVDNQKPVAENPNIVDNQKNYTNKEIYEMLLQILYVVTDIYDKFE
jgi:hypothetical protein